MNNAKIIAVTQPTITSGLVGASTLDQLLTVDEFIAYVARVSNPSNQNNTLTASKLLRYLAKHKHWSPFEMVNIVMEINTSRDIARQILRHRSFSFQEFSQRYADPTQDLGFVHREARLQDLKNRQNSIETDDKNLQEVWDEWQAGVLDEARIAYAWAVNNGIAKEQARAVLPEGLTVSRMYMNGTLRSWIHYCQLRSGPETQKEHREIAIDAWNQIVEKFPSLKDALDL
jgi:thymidylate synthase (FAD)